MSNSADPLYPGNPSSLGGYRVRERLGRGGMGTVHLAHDPEGRAVALKLIHPHLADDEHFRRRFAREVEAARRVARFSTAGVIDAELEGEPLYIVSEYIAGPNLSRAVRESGPMSGGTLDSLAMGVAAALTAIHGSGVIHRDLKPTNVLLSPVGPKVIDFGIARALDDASGAITRSSQLMGTPSYMAPELILGEQATAASDIFAWGCLVTFAGTGRAPFDAPTVPAVLHNISSGEPHLDGLDPGLLELVRSTLDKNPHNRPTSPQLLARLTGQEEPEEAEVARTITTSWAPPSNAPVPGKPPEGEDPAKAPPAFQGTLRGPQASTPPGGRSTQHHVPPTQVHGAPPPYPPQHGGPGHPPSGPHGSRPGGKKRIWLVIGAAMAAVVLIAGTVFALTRPPSVPGNTLSLYETDFSSEPDWVSSTYKGADSVNSDGHWPEQRGVLLRVDPSSRTSRGEYLHREDETLPDRVLVTADTTVLEGPDQAMFGARCWGNDSEDEFTAYEALMRYDGQQTEIRRRSEESGDRALAETTDVRGFEPFPTMADGESLIAPYQGFDSSEATFNTLTLSCEYVDDGDEPHMELSLWLNDEFVVSAVDENPLPDDAEDPEDRRLAGITTRSAPGNDTEVSAFFTSFSVHEIRTED